MFIILFVSLRTIYVNAKTSGFLSLCCSLISFVTLHVVVANYILILKKKTAILFGNSNDLYLLWHNFSFPTFIEYSIRVKS